jgi:chlorite dismutase
MSEPPQTDEGWCVLHEFRSVDWAAWRNATDRERAAAVESGQEWFADRAAEPGDTAVFSLLGDGPDLLVLLFRSSMAALDRARRELEGTAFADLFDGRDAYVSVTEVSGYVSQAYFEEGETESGLGSYIESKLHPEVPDSEYVSFYPMSKRREPDANWYALDFEERADLMGGHGDTGRRHADEVDQVISASTGLDDWEWAVTLFADDATKLKDVVYEMRFDESSAVYAEFGGFRLGRQFAPAELRAFFDGEPLGASEDDTQVAERVQETDDSDGGAERAGGPPDSPDADDLAVEGGEARDGVHARVCYSEADPESLSSAVDDLREDFDHYDSHHQTDVYEPADGDGPAAVVSTWETAKAAGIAAGFLDDLPDTVGRATEDTPFPDGGAEEWGTMGLFYTVEPEHREAFVETFEEVGETLGGMDGHRSTDLYVNRADENDMFIASRWRSREDALEFFRSDAFSETVSWGRGVLADTPRHVYLS